MDEIQKIGPVQLLAIGFDEDARFEGRIMDELANLERHETIRILDLLFVGEGRRDWRPAGPRLPGRRVRSHRRRAAGLRFRRRGSHQYPRRSKATPSGSQEGRFRA